MNNDVKQLETETKWEKQKQLDHRETFGSQICATFKESCIRKGETSMDA